MTCVDWNSNDSLLRESGINIPVPVRELRFHDRHSAVSYQTRNKTNLNDPQSSILSCHVTKSSVLVHVSGFYYATS